MTDPTNSEEIDSYLLKLKMSEEIGSYFINLWRKRTNVEVELVDEIPTALDTVKNFGDFVVVRPDGLSVSYPYISVVPNDEGAVQANRPVPTKQMFYYFEMSIQNAGIGRNTAIGFSPPDFIIGHHPGRTSGSYGYHGYNGRVYYGSEHEHEHGIDFGHIFGDGDTVGAGINFDSSEFFFTLNGKGVGTMPKTLRSCRLFPTISVASLNAEVTVNFGQNPFVFNMHEYEAEYKSREYSRVDNITISPDPSHGIVRSYLQHYGYEATLKSEDMDEESNGFSDEESMYALDQRSTLRQLIRCGEIDDAFSKLREWYPQLVQDGMSTVCFLLHCQKFIELIRAEKLVDARQYNEFLKFERSPDVGFLVQDCYTLLENERPDESPVGYLLQESQKELVADAVNAMILSTNPNVIDAKICMHSRLERLTRQNVACYKAKRWGECEAFHLDRILNRRLDTSY